MASGLGKGIFESNIQHSDIYIYLTIGSSKSNTLGLQRPKKVLSLLKAPQSSFLEGIWSPSLGVLALVCLSSPVFPYSNALQNNKDHAKSSPLSSPPARSIGWPRLNMSTSPTTRPGKCQLVFLVLVLLFW